MSYIICIHACCLLRGVNPDSTLRLRATGGVVVSRLIRDFQVASKLLFDTIRFGVSPVFQRPNRR